MIEGVGTDLVEISRFARLYDRYGDRLAEKLLAPEERKMYHSALDPARFLAKRFAVKEAVAKALGTGFRQGVTLAQITLDHESSGRPVVVLSGRAKAVAAAKSVSRIHVSLSDERHYVVAVVLFESCCVG